MDKFMFTFGMIAILLLLWKWFVDLNTLRRSIGSRQLFKSKLFLGSAFFAITILITKYLSGIVGMESMFANLSSFQLYAAVPISALISFGWYVYLRRLDVYEADPFLPQIIVFVLACTTIWLVFPMSDFLQVQLGFSLGQSAVLDWWYCVIGIGLVEEIVKIIPVLLLLRFSKHINSPFDYIFYGSIAALGFAFIENVKYLSLYDLRPTGGRVLYAAVAHMFFTSIICYVMALQRFKVLMINRLLAFAIGLILASFAHGFYDYWLISQWMRDYEFMTTVFFLISVSIWATMKNNLLNISNFRSRQIHLKNTSFKYLIINIFTTAAALSYLAIYLFEGKFNANQYIIGTIVYGLFTLAFISFSFAGIRIIPGYVKPFWKGIQVSKMIIPYQNLFHDEIGEKIMISRPVRQKDGSIKRVVFRGDIVENAVVEDELGWYLLHLFRPYPFKKYDNNYLLVCSREGRHQLSTDNWVRAEVRVLNNAPLDNKMVFKKGESLFLFNGKAKEIEDDQ